MHDLSYDEAKVEVDRLLFKPIMIGSMWANRDLPGISVVVHGFHADKVRVSQWGMVNAFLEHNVIDFLKSYRLVPFSQAVGD